MYFGWNYGLVSNGQIKERRAKMLKPKNSKIRKEEMANTGIYRKSYIKPKLTEFGHLEQLTHGATGPNRDLQSGKMPIPKL